MYRYAMASGSSSASSSINRTACLITHSKTGTQFTVYLTEYEMEQYQQDATFAEELTKKYYTLFTRGLVTNIEASDDELEPREEQRSVITADVEEQLITLVAQRPPLFDFRLPLAERSRAAARALWEEVVAELEVDISVEAVSKKWKNMRDSYIRARSNINKKLRSGSSAEEKRTAERLKAKHRHYEAMEFLDDTLTRRPTSSNLETDVEMNATPPDTPSTSRSRRSSNNSNDNTSAGRTNTGSTNATEQAFLDAIGKISNGTPFSSDTYHFCMRLAAGLERLPRPVKNQLELEFLHKVVEAKAQYCDQTEHPQERSLI